MKYNTRTVVTQSIVGKITPELLVPIENEFINLCARNATSRLGNREEILFQKLHEFKDAQLLDDSNNIKVAEKILLIDKYRRDGNTKNRKEIEEEITNFLYPNFE